jgi:hypothetical protein
MEITNNLLRKTNMKNDEDFLNNILNRVEPLNDF